MSNYFKNSYRYIWRDTASMENLMLNLNAIEPHEILFTVPKLVCQGATTNGVWVDLGEINTITRVFKQRVINGVIQPEKIPVLESPKASGAISFAPRNDDIAVITANTLALRKVGTFSYDLSTIQYSSFQQIFGQYPQIAHASSEFADKTVSFVTEQLTEAQLAAGEGWFYSIECSANPDNASGMISYFCVAHSGYEYVLGLPSRKHGGRCSILNADKVNPEHIKATASFYVKDMTNTAEGGPFLMKGAKYNAYQLLRKAILTVDVHLIDNNITGLDEALVDGVPTANNIPLPIIIDPNWKDKLKNTLVYETVLENKNLWEICLQVGKYLHAEPKLVFADDGTDRFMLTFKQLGASEIKQDKSNKITIYNSQNLAEYFASFDSYVTNLFSPQNLCRELLVPKCGDGTFLVSDDNAELKTTYGISEIVSFRICHNGVWKDAINAQVQNNNGEIIKLSSKIYEKSIYDILTSEFKVSPSKADSLFFAMGDTKISGLNYTPPSPNNDQPYALKKIVQQLFGVSTNNLKFNDLMFEIVYRTQDEARMTQIRPDIERFMKNSSCEKYPHHEQFYGQLDKIPDSERFSANMWGQLVRSGNRIHQVQECCTPTTEKEVGELYIKDGIPCYVVETENEEYNDCILQKVTYSAYWNEISMITCQNSENRMYEVSEKTLTRRELRPMDFLSFSSRPPTQAHAPTYLNNDTWKSFIKNLVFREAAPSIPTHAYVKFLADQKRQHTGGYGQVVEHNQLFPSSEIVREDANNIRPADSKGYSEVIVPVLRFPKKDGILFEFDMQDNFQAGTFIDTTIDSGSTNNGAFYAEQPVRYVDILGRADLMQFKLFNLGAAEQLVLSDMQALTKAPSALIPTEANSSILTPPNLSIALDKDCREAISVDYQLNFLNKELDLITFSNLFNEKSNRLKLMFFNKEIGMFDQFVNLLGGMLADNVPYTLIDNETNNSIELNITPPQNVNLTEVKSLVWYDEEPSGKTIYLAVNVGRIANEDKLKTRYIYPVFNDN